MNNRENGWAASLSRRGFLKGGAVVGAIAAGSGASLLAPTTSRADTAKVVVQYTGSWAMGRSGTWWRFTTPLFQGSGPRGRDDPRRPQLGDPCSNCLRPGPTRPVFRRFAAAAGPLGRRPARLFATGYQQAPFADSRCRGLRCINPRIFTASASEFSRPPAPRWTR